MRLIDADALLRKLFPYNVVDKKNYAINAYAVEKTILDMPVQNREIKNLCGRCLHHDACYARMQADDGKLMYLTKCDFYNGGGD